MRGFQLRSSRIVLCLLTLFVGWAALPLPMARAADNEALGEPCEKNLMKDAIDLLEQAWKKAGILDMKVSDVLGPAGASGMPYEPVDKGSGPVEPTMQDMINHLRDMLEKGNIVRKEMRGNGTVDVQPGIASDKIVISKALLAKICNPATSACDRVVCKFQLMATLANELAHVFQPWTTATDEQKCDGERDSDCNSINALAPLLAALSKADGTPHTSINDVFNDPDYVMYLRFCLILLGATDADLACIHMKLKAKLGATGATATTGTGYTGRKARFGFDLTPPYTRWATWYYAGHDDVVEGGATEDEVGRTGTTMVGSDLIATRFYSVPAGQLVVSRPFFNANGQLMLATALSTPSGGRMIRLWRDNDNDGLPELTPIATVNLPPLPPGTRPMYTMQITAGIPSSFHSAGTTNGLFILDNIAGEFFKIELQASGAPMGPAVELIDHPTLRTPQFILYMHEIDLSPGPMDSRLVFGQVNSGEPPVVWFDFNGPTYTPGPPGQPPAMAYAPTNVPGIQTLVATAPNGLATLTGNPFTFLQMLSIGRGSPQDIVATKIGPTGRSAPTLTSGAIQGNDLFMVNGSGSPERGMFLPPEPLFLARRGTNIDAVVVDEAGDANPDRVHLSVDPPRLHFLRGLVPDDSLYNHELEIALEDLEYGGFRAWSGIDGRRLRHPEVDIVITKVSLFDPPPYAQRLVDFALDTTADEAMILGRFTPANGFTARFFNGINAAPALLQAIPLPVAFDPGGIVYGDLNGDGRLDITITDFDGGPPICLINSANPPGTRFSIGSCSVVPTCCSGNADKVSPGAVVFADVITVLGNFNLAANPNGSTVGDADCNGLINFADITSVLANFGDSCP